MGVRPTCILVAGGAAMITALGNGSSRISYTAAEWNYLRGFSSAPFVGAYSGGNRHLDIACDPMAL